MNTRELLEKITDAGEFEVLATNVLRAAESRYRSLSHPGVNAEGKPIRSPVDGIGVTLEPSGRTLILTAHTTCSRNKLRGKWLTDVDSDCKKALKIIEDERKRKSFDSAVVVLTTNREPLEDLYRDVCSQAGTDISFDIWTGSRLASFLDNDPEGQWLRSQAFGSNPQRLSSSLLNEISRISVERNCPPFETDTGIQRSADGSLEEFAKARTGTGFIFGESGQGKSVAAWRFAKNAIEQKEPLVYLSDATVERCTTIEQALTVELKAIKPSLGENCGRDAIALRSASEPLLLIVEDANAAKNPEKLIQKMLAWQKPPNQPEDAPPPRWRLLCPLWPSLATNAEPRIRNQAFQYSMSIGAFERSEAIEVVQKRSQKAGSLLTKVRADKIAKALGDDPLLIALTEDFAAQSDSAVIRSFVDYNLSKAANQDRLSADLRIALDQLMQKIVANAILAPDWQTIRSWFADDLDTANSLRRIFNQGKVARLAQVESTDRLAFRHDRVRDFLLGEALASLATLGDLSDQTVSDPFFAELFGRVMEQIPEHTLNDLASHNAAAYFAALKHNDSDAQAVKTYVSSAVDWINSDQFSRADNKQRRYHAIELLAQTDGDFVIDLAERFKDSHWGQVEARLRNGDVKAGIQLCLSFDPSVRHPWRDRLIEHAVEKFPQIKTDLQEFLQNDAITEDGLYGALNLFGEIADSNMSETLKRVWFQEPTVERISGAWLWAALMCFDGEDKSLLDSLCDVWVQLPEKEPTENDRDRSPRWDLVGHSLPFALARKPHKPAVDYLIAKAETREELDWPVRTIIKHVDLPQAVTWIARQMAEVDIQVEGTDRVHMWSMTSDRIWKANDHGQQMGVRSKLALFAVWNNPNEEKWYRIRAFDLWSQTMTAAEVKDLTRLETDEVLADRALRKRLSNDDKTAITLLRKRLIANDSAREDYWWYQARKVGLDELSDLVESTLEARREGKLKTYKDGGTETDHILAELLMDRRDEYSEQVLLRHWDHLKDCSEYVLAALYICTPPLVERARQVIDNSDDPKEWFKYLFMKWGDKTVGRLGIVDRSQVEVLQNYVKFLDKMALRNLFRICNEMGLIGWRQEHVDPVYFAQKEIEGLSSEAGIFQSLDRLADDDTTDGIGVHYWLKYRQEEGLAPTGLITTIWKWAIDRESTKATFILCATIQELGSRADLALLSDSVLHASDEAIAAIKNCQYAVKRRTPH